MIKNNIYSSLPPGLYVNLNRCDFGFYYILPRNKKREKYDAWVFSQKDMRYEFISFEAKGYIDQLLPVTDPKILNAALKSIQYYLESKNYDQMVIADLKKVVKNS